MSHDTDVEMLREKQRVEYEFIREDPTLNLPPWRSDIEIGGNQSRPSDSAYDRLYREYQASKSAASLEHFNNARERRAQEAELGVLRNQQQAVLRALGVDEATISSRSDNSGNHALQETILVGIQQLNEEAARAKSEAHAIAIAARRPVGERDVREAECEAQGALVTVMRDTYMDTPLSTQQIEDMRPHQMAACVIGRLKQLSQWTSAAEAKHRRQLQRVKSPGSWTYDMGFADGLAKAERRESEPAKHTRSQTTEKKEEGKKEKGKRKKGKDTHTTPIESKKHKGCEPVLSVTPLPTPTDDPPVLSLSDSPEF